MRTVRWVAVVAVVFLVIGVAAVWYLTRSLVKPSPGCTVTAPAAASNGSNATDSTSSASSGPTSYTLTPEQADNAATIAGVGMQLGMPDHAVTVAVATALQESKLINLTSGDRDSAGLFQQRPSQGWGTYAQVTDPIHASTAFYQALRRQPGWTQLSVTEAAQLVQHSAAPDAYAQWEQEARAIASALTGEFPAALTCHDLAIAAPSASLVDTAAAELGTTALSGAHASARGWALSSWLVAHAGRLGVDRVTFDGQTWTAVSGTWSQTGAADGTLSLHQVPPQSGSVTSSVSPP